MTQLTIGKIRGLQQISTREGLFVILAMDHRGTLARMLGISGQDPKAYGTIRDFKLMIVENLAACASGVLLDPQYSAAEAVARGTLPAERGMIIAMEKSGYGGTSTARTSQVLPGWSIAKAKRMGASAVKLLVDYNPRSGALAEQQEALVSQVVAEARAADLALLLEPVTYATDPAAPKGSAGFAALRPALVVETARRLGALGPDVLKLEFPHDATYVKEESAWQDACAGVDEAAPVPWAVLSAGVDFETFKRQVRIACQAGASGYVAGRSFWQEAVGVARAEAPTFLRNVAAPRVAETAEIARQYGKPWTARYPKITESAGPEWYMKYEG